MAEPELAFRYVAADASGRRISGAITARSEGEAFARLRREGLSPLHLRPGPPPRRRMAPLADRDVADLVGGLGELLKAGADMRAALDVLASRAGKPAAAAACQALARDIGGGGALDQAFARALPRHADLVAAMAAAGEVSGDLPGSLVRSAEMIERRLALRQKLISTLAYPGFVLASTLAAVGALLLFVIPALAPLAEAAETPPPTSLRLMILASDLFRRHLTELAIAAALGAAGILAAARAGVAGRLADRALMLGPASRTAGGLVYGGFAIALGGMLSAGAPMSEALRLAHRAVPSPLARRRLAPVIATVRQGQTLSAALDSVGGFPAAISRLAAVGEATSALGGMLARGGRLEEDAAMRRIEAFGQVLGPALIILLGGVVGLLMAGLLSGVSQLGDAALM